MRSLHRNTLLVHSISARAHAPIRIFTSQVHTSLYRRSTRRCECLASLQQSVESFRRARTATSRSELDVTCLLAALGSSSIQTHSESIQRVACIGQHHIASTLRKHSPNLTAKIKPLIDPVGKPSARLDSSLPVAFFESRQQHRRLRVFRLSPLRSERHHRSKIAWPIAELLI